MDDDIESLDLFADARLIAGTASLDGEIEVLELSESLEEPQITDDVVIQIDDTLNTEVLVEPSIEVEELDATFEPDNTGQMAFIDFDEWWKVEWQGMPEFIQDDQTAWKTLLVHFQCRDDMDLFAQLIAHPLTSDTRWVWYPPQQREQLKEKRYVDES